MEEQQQGKERADYGTELLKELSKALTAEFGKGFSVGSLYYYRQFYITFPEIFATPWRILSWFHYKKLIQVNNPKESIYYIVQLLMLAFRANLLYISALILIGTT